MARLLAITGPTALETAVKGYGMMQWIDRVPLGILVVAALTLGLAPFLPEPHVWEKLKLLASGELRRPIDVFDLLLHAAPWLLLALKLVRGRTRPGD